MRQRSIKLFFICIFYMYFVSVLKAGSPRLRCQQGWFLLRPLNLQARAFWLCPHTGFPLCAHTPGVSLCIQISSFHKDTIQTGFRSHSKGFI